MAYYRGLSGIFGQTSDQFEDIFAEFDFACFSNECDFFCPDCRNMLKCAAYQEFRDEWELFYT